MSIGNKLGRAIGHTAAYAGHVVIVAAVGSGKFGADVVNGAQLGYVERRGELEARRALAAAKTREIAAQVAATMQAQAPAPTPTTSRRGAVLVTK